jgi:hypothetical protein
MKKFILAFEPPYFSVAAMEFARHHNEHEPVLVKGLFSNKLSMLNIWSNGISSVGEILNSTQEDDHVYETKQQIEFFQEFCENHNLVYTLQTEKVHYSLNELNLDSRDADILIIVSSSIYEKSKDCSWNELIINLLKHSECPLLVVPPEAPYSTHTYVVLNGSKEQSFALKQFIYLFPEWSKKPTYLIAIEKEKNTDSVKDSKPEVFVSRYFNQVFKIQLKSLNHGKLNSDNDLRQKGLVISGVRKDHTSAMTEIQNELSEWAIENRLPLFICGC